MNSDHIDGGRPDIEDYGSPATDTLGSSNELGSASSSSVAQYSGGTEGTQEGSGEGEQFGEFGSTGTGTDLTVEMENSDARTGMVKGGEQGADDVGGPARYGGSAGSVGGESTQ
ncbi:MAG: hypothetical protein M3328_14625 [Chloroflexota bacterium]|nr:hypothetical protein [Chloroflexota bacterium]